jgi:hypothetical protein
MLLTDTSIRSTKPGHKPIRLFDGGASSTALEDGKNGY